MTTFDLLCTALTSSMLTWINWRSEPVHRASPTSYLDPAFNCSHFRIAVRLQAILRVTVRCEHSEERGGVWGKPVREC